MITRFKSALNQIKAEKDLVSKTEVYLRAELTKNHNYEITKLTKVSLISIKKFVMATSFVILFFIGSSIAYAYYKTPISYLSLDINPSIELGVNAFGKVVIAEGYNVDGKKVLKGVNATGSNVIKAVRTLISSAVENDFISNDGTTIISITSETDNPNTAAKLAVDAETGANEALKENGKMAVIHKDNVSISLHEEAKAIGITAGKLNLINQLQSVDPTVTVDQYKDVSVKDIMQDIQKNTNNGEVNNKEESEVNNKDEGEVNNKEESEVNNKEESEVNNKDEGEVNNKDEGGVNNKEESVVNSKEESAVNSDEKSIIDNNNEGVVENNSQVIDTGNTDKNAESVGSDNVSDSDGENSDSNGNN